MLGRIDMSRLCFIPVPEEPGRVDKDFFKNISLKSNRYTYSFTNAKKQLFNVFINEGEYFVKNDLTVSCIHIVTISSNILLKNNYEFIV